MEYKVICSADEYKKTVVQSEYIPVIVTASYIFAGPLSRPESQCFKCFYNSLNDNESFLFEILENSLNNKIGHDLSELEWECLKNLDTHFERRVALISRKDYSVEYLPVHCHPLTACKKNKVQNECRKIDRSYRIDTDRRVKSGIEIFTEKNNDRLLRVHSGIGKQIVRDADSSIIPMYYVKSNVLTSRYYSYGRSTTLQNSKMSAVFEMLERYASIVPHRQPDLEGSYYELVKAGKSVISPRDLCLNIVNEDISKQYGFEPYSDERIYRWTRTMNLVDEKEYYLPEQAMYYDGQLVSGEKRFLYETSNGCAMGGNYEEAVMYALLELVERDAFLMHWYNRVAPVQFDISSIHNRYLLDIVKYMTCIGYEIRIMNITMETGIPAIWVAAIDKTFRGKMKCYNAAGAHMNPEKALEAALVEVVTSIGIYDKIIRRGSMDEKLTKLSENPDAVDSMEDHVYFYSLDENYKYIEHYYSNEEMIDFVEYFKEWYQSADHTFSVQEFLDRFSKYHKDIYVGILESETNKELGLWCVKAIVPSMLTMTFGVRNQRLNIERIQKGAVLSGIREVEIPEEYINTTPHPFP